MAGPPSDFDALIQKLRSLNALQPEEMEAVRHLPIRKVEVRSGTTIIYEDQQITECCLLLEGYACRYKVASDGGRQIVSFHIPGDILDIQHLLFDRADHNVQTISAATLAYFPMAALRTLIDERPAIGTALWRDCLVDASVFREWVLNVGRRCAKERIAHMLCEFAARAESAGIGPAQGLALPMTQADIADATGLTPVHVNRMLRALREDGSLARQGIRFFIADWELLKRTADFSPNYLHLAA